MIREEKPFLAKERTNNKLTQPMHVWRRRFRDINPGRIFCANLYSYSLSSLHIRQNKHTLTQPKFHSILFFTPLNYQHDKV